NLLGPPLEQNAHSPMPLRRRFERTAARFLEDSRSCSPSLLRTTLFCPIQLVREFESFCLFPRPPRHKLCPETLRPYNPHKSYRFLLRYSKPPGNFGARP